MRDFQSDRATVFELGSLAWGMNMPLIAVSQAAKTDIFQLWWDSSDCWSLLEEFLVAFDSVFIFNLGLETAFYRLRYIQDHCVSTLGAGHPLNPGPSHAVGDRPSDPAPMRASSDPPDVYLFKSRPCGQGGTTGLVLSGRMCVEWPASWRIETKGTSRVSPALLVPQYLFRD